MQYVRFAPKPFPCGEAHREMVSMGINAIFFLHNRRSKVGTYLLCYHTQHMLFDTEHNRDVRGSHSFAHDVLHSGVTPRFDYFIKGIEDTFSKSQRA